MTHWVGRRGSEPILFAVLVVAALLPLLRLRHFVSIDGPSHLEGAQVLLHHGRPLLSRYYRIDLFPTPNLAGELLLAAALAITSVATAEKLVVAAYVVTFLLGFRYAVRGARGDAVAWSYLGFAFVYQRLLFYGFYNYCFGVALALLGIGFVLRRPLPWSRRTTLAVAGLVLVTYFAHLLPALVLALFVVIVVAVDVIGHRGDARASGRRAIGPLLSLVPTCVLAVIALLRPGTGSTTPAWSSTPVARVIELVTLRNILQVFGRGEVVVAALLGLVLLAATALALTRRTAKPVHLVCGVAAVVTALCYLATPTSVGADYGYLVPRLAVFPVFFTLLFLAAGERRGRWVAPALGAVGVVAAVALAAVRDAPLRHYDHRISEVLSTASVIRHDSTLLVVRLALDAPKDSPWHRTTDPLRHIASLVAARTDGVDLGHYEAQLPYFPTQFRHEFLFEVRTGRPFVAGERVPPQATLFDRPQPPAYVPDYVLVIGARQASTRTLDAKPVKRLMRALRARYRLVDTTSPTGLVQVYERVS